MFNLFKTGQNAGQNNENICEKGKKSSKFGHDQTILSSILTVANIKLVLKKVENFQNIMTRIKLKRLKVSKYYEENCRCSFCFYSLINILSIV